MTAGEEHKGGSTTAQGDIINRKQAVTCRNYTIRGLFGLACIYPGEQIPVGAANPEELQYLPAGQGWQPE